MSQLLEKLRQAAEGFADPNVENEVSYYKWVKAKEKVTQKVESFFTTPHREAGKMTLNEHKCEAGDAM